LAFVLGGTMGMRTRLNVGPGGLRIVAVGSVLMLPAPVRHRERLMWTVWWVDGQHELTPSGSWLW
jgi:hypothetical protein